MIKCRFHIKASYRSELLTGPDDGGCMFIQMLASTKIFLWCCSLTWPSLISSPLWPQLSYIRHKCIGSVSSCCDEAYGRMMYYMCSQTCPNFNNCIWVLKSCRVFKQVKDQQWLTNWCHQVCYRKPNYNLSTSCRRESKWSMYYIFMSSWKNLRTIQKISVQ